MQCCCLPQYLCRNPPQTLGYSCKDKRIAPAGRHLLQKTTSSGTTTVLFSLSLPPSFPITLPSFSKYLHLSHFAISLSPFPPLPPPPHPPHRGGKSHLECNLTLWHEISQLILMIKEDQAVSNECPQDMLTLYPCASPSIRHKLASTHPQGH